MKTKIIENDKRKKINIFFKMTGTPKNDIRSKIRLEVGQQYYGLQKTINN